MLANSAPSLTSAVSMQLAHDPQVSLFYTIWQQEPCGVSFIQQKKNKSECRQRWRELQDPA